MVFVKWSRIVAGKTSYIFLYVMLLRRLADYLFIRSLDLIELLAISFTGNYFIYLLVHALKNQHLDSVDCLIKPTEQAT